MLDVIGAGATASVKEDWHEIWTRSEEYGKVQVQIEEIHTKGRARPPVETEIATEYATNWFNQLAQLIKRDASVHNRDPSYMMAKIMLNIVAGLFLGFSFFLSDDTQQGTQNKLFVSYLRLLCRTRYLPFPSVHIYGHYHLSPTCQPAAAPFPQNALHLRDP